MTIELGGGGCCIQVALRDELESHLCTLPSTQHSTIWLHRPSLRPVCFDLESLRHERIIKEAYNNAVTAPQFNFVNRRVNGQRVSRHPLMIVVFAPRGGTHARGDDKE